MKIPVLVLLASAGLYAAPAAAQSQSSLCAGLSQPDRKACLQRDLERTQRDVDVTSRRLRTLNKLHRGACVAERYVREGTVAVGAAGGAAIGNPIGGAVGAGAAYDFGKAAGGAVKGKSDC